MPHKDASPARPVTCFRCYVASRRHKAAWPCMQVSEHACWSSKYYGQIISAALAAVGESSMLMSGVHFLHSGYSVPLLYVALSRGNDPKVLARSTWATSTAILSSTGAHIASLANHASMGRCRRAKTGLLCRCTTRPCSDRDRLCRGRECACDRWREQGHLCGEHRGRKGGHAGAYVDCKLPQFASLSCMRFRD